jgi:transcriptional regulator with XRE-family HTH domain
MKARSIGALVAGARKAEGLTQADLARRMGTTQSAVARLEAAGSNPRVSTVEKALRACGHTLQPQAKAFEDSVDGSLVRAGLGMTPAERIAHHRRSRQNAIDLARKARPVSVDT